MDVFTCSGQDEIRAGQSETITLMDQSLVKLQQVLQQSLKEGLANFKNSDENQILARLFDFVSGTKYYESEFGAVVPNPAYDNAARIIGRPFLRAARNLGLQFEESFPGNFYESEELKIEERTLRRFRLKAYSNKGLVCILRIDFTHSHDKFEFPIAPTLSIEAPPPDVDRAES
jgi:hypothetical protein